MATNYQLVRNLSIRSRIVLSNKKIKTLKTKEKTLKP